MKYAFAFVGALAGQALAGGWGDSGSFNCPANTNNQCDDSQKSGWDFNDLPTGPVSSYNGHEFSGFNCESGGKGRRSLDKRFGGNCLAGAAHPGSGPSFACGKDKEGFSVSHLHLSTEEDSDLEFHYGMPDGSTCKHTSPCQSGGNIVSNDQCGGATSVSVQLPHTATKSCSVSVYSVGFDCSTASTTVPPKSTPPPYSAPSSPPAVSTPSSTPSIPVYSTPSSTPETSSVPSTSSTPTSPVIPSTSSKPSIPVYSTPSSTPETSSTPSSTPTSPVIPSTSSTPSSTTPSSTPTSPVIPSTSSTPSIPVYSSPSIPVYSSPSVPYSVPSKSLPPYSVPSVPLSTAPSSTPNSPVTPSSSSASSTSPVPSPPCPTVLPKCLNSWLWQSGCSDNGDYECYCKQADFASKVCGCLTAYGADEQETQEAVNYFLGICAKYVPDNYGFLNGQCPKPSPPVSSAPPSSTPNSPVTPSSIPETQTTVYVTGYTTTCPVGHTVTSGSVTTTLSTPSVSTIYSTTTSTICTKCTEIHTPPASSPESPVTPPVESPPASMPNSPVTPSAPASVPASPTPCTTLTISKTFTVPVTYTTGESYGATVPSSSVATTIVSTITVPQVVITSTKGGQGGLAYGTTPAPAPAVSTPAGAVPAVPVPPPGTTGFGTTYKPGPTGNNTAPITSAFQGAAVKMQAGSVAGLVLGFAAMAL